jgi:enoyl-[acyl-carrier protein] reductase / trans-2-enoyl-CoA reductase (NAD+)
MKIEAKVRNNIGLTSHPVGCARLVDEQIASIKAKGRFDGPRNALIIGSSNGYGLASRLVLAFGAGARTLGVFYEKPAAADSAGSAGWYNTVAFMRRAREAGIPAWNINGDAFTNGVREQATALLREHMGPVDLVVYSVAAPRRTDPATGAQYTSAIKPIGKPYTTRNIDWKTKQMVETTMDAASPDEIASTVKVMGGEDWELWLDHLAKAGLLARGVKAVAFSYIGPEVTHSIYRDGTIGRAKKHLEETTRRLDAGLAASLGGRCLISVNKALVTRASAVIPAVPLYISLLYKIMKQKGTHEGCLEQMVRLYYDRLYSGKPLELDDEQRIRMDDWEMDPEVQSKVARLWNQVTTENLYQLADARGYRDEFFLANGFEVPGVDYEADVDLAQWAAL